MQNTNFEEAWKEFDKQYPSEDGDPHADEWIFKAGYEAGYEAAKKEAQRVVSFFED